MNSTAADSIPVPARIVIMGTGKLRLSERFNRIQIEKPPQQKQQIVRKLDSVGVGGVVNGGPVIQRPCVFERMSSQGSVSGRSFLHDDYMDNELYGGESIPRGPVLGRMRSNYAYQDEIDPVKLSLEDYNTFQRTHPRRPFGSRPFVRNFAMFDEEEEYVDLADEIPSNPRSNMYNSVFRKPIHQRLSYRPSGRISDFALRRPIRNTFIFKRPFRGRYGGQRYNSHWFGGRGGVRGGQFGKGRWNERKLKKTVQQMDRELDEYMKASKHPRVQVTN